MGFYFSFWGWYKPHFQHLRRQLNIWPAEDFPITRGAKNFLNRTACGPASPGNTWRIKRNKHETLDQQWPTAAENHGVFWQKIMFFLTCVPVFTIKCKTVRPIDKLWNQVHGHGSNLKLPKGIRIWINSVTREVGDTQWRFWKASDGMPKPPANCGRFMDAGNSKGWGNLETSKLDLRSRAARTGSSHQGDIRSRETSTPAQVTEIHPLTLPKWSDAKVNDTPTCRT